MEIKTFIKDVLVEIAEGTRDAIEALGESESTARVKSHASINSELVEFDMAVTAVESNGKNTDAGVKVAWIKAGGELSQSTENSAISRVKFSIPFAPPTSKREEAKFQPLGAPKISGIA